MSSLADLYVPEASQDNADFDPIMPATPEIDSLDVGLDATFDAIKETMNAVAFDEDFINEDTRIRSMRPLPRLTAGDAFADLARDPVKYLPFVRSIKLVDAFRDMQLSKKITDGTATPEEEKLFNQKLQEQQREQSLGYKVWSSVFNMVPYSVEVGSGLGVLKGAAKQVLARSATEQIAKAGARTAANKAMLSQADDLMKYAAYNVKAHAAANGLHLPMSEQFGRATVGKLLPKVMPGSKTAKALEWWAEGASAGEYGVALQPHNAYKFATKELAKQGDVRMFEPIEAELRRQFGSKIADQMKKEFLGGTFDTAKAAAAEVAKKGALTAAGKGLLYEGPIRGALTQPNMVVEEMVGNMTDKYQLTADEQGQLHRVLVEKGDGFIPALGKGFAAALIEASSETGGGNIAYYAGHILGPHMSKVAAGGFVDGILDKASGSGTLKVAKAMLFGTPDRPGMLTASGLDGWIPNMVEEGMVDLMRGAVGMQRNMGALGGTLPTFDEMLVRGLSFALNPMNAVAYTADSLNQRTTLATRRMIEGFDNVATAAMKVGRERESLQEAAEGPLLESISELVDIERSRTEAAEHKGLKGIAYRTMDWVKYGLERRKLSSVYAAHTGHEASEIARKFIALEDAAAANTDLYPPGELEANKAAILSLQLNERFPGLLTTKSAAEKATQLGLDVDADGKIHIETKATRNVAPDAVPADAKVLKTNDDGTVDYALVDDIDIRKLSLAFAINPGNLNGEDIALLLRESPEMLATVTDMSNRGIVHETSAAEFLGKRWEQLSEAERISFAKIQGNTQSNEIQMREGKQAYELAQALASALALSQKDGKAQIALRFRLPQVLVGSRPEIEKAGGVLRPGATVVGKRGEEDLFAVRDNGSVRYDTVAGQTVIAVPVGIARHAMIEEVGHASLAFPTGDAARAKMLDVAQITLELVNEYVDKAGKDLSAEDAFTARAIRTMLTGQGEFSASLNTAAAFDANKHTIEEFYLKAFKIGRMGMNVAPPNLGDVRAPDPTASSRQVPAMDAALFLSSDLGRKLLKDLTGDGAVAHALFDAPMNAALQGNPGLLNAMLLLAPDQPGESKWVAPLLTPDDNARLDELYQQLSKVQGDLAKMEKDFTDDQLTLQGDASTRYRSLRDNMNATQNKLDDLWSKARTELARPLGQGTPQPQKPADMRRSLEVVMDRGNEADIVYGDSSAVAAADKTATRQESVARIMGSAEAVKAAKPYADGTKAKFARVLDRFLDHPWLDTPTFLASGVLESEGLTAAGHYKAMSDIVEAARKGAPVTDAQKATLEKWNKGTKDQRPKGHGATSIMPEYEAEGGKLPFAWDDSPAGAGGSGTDKETRTAAGSRVDILGRLALEGRPLPKGEDAPQWQKGLYRELSDLRQSLMADGTQIVTDGRWMIIDGDKVGQLDIMLVHPDGSVSHVDIKAESEMAGGGRTLKTLHDVKFSAPWNGADGNPIRVSLEQRYATQAYAYRYGHQQLDPDVKIRGSFILPVHNILNPDGTIASSKLDRADGKLMINLPVDGAQVRFGANEVLQMPMAPKPEPVAPKPEPVASAPTPKTGKPAAPVSKKAAKKKARESIKKVGEGERSRAVANNDKFAALLAAKNKSGETPPKYSLSDVSSRDIADSLSPAFRETMRKLLRNTNWLDDEARRLARLGKLPDQATKPYGSYNAAEKEALFGRIERDYMARFLRIMQPDAQLPVTESARKWETAQGLKAMMRDLVSKRDEAYGRDVTWRKSLARGDISQEVYDGLRASQDALNQLWSEVEAMERDLGGARGKAAREFAKARKPGRLHNELTAMPFGGLTLGDYFAILMDSPADRAKFGKSGTITRNDFGTLRRLLHAATNTGGVLDNDAARADVDAIMQRFADLVTEQDTVLAETTQVRRLAGPADGSDILPATIDLLEADGADLSADKSSGDIHGAEKFYQSLREGGPVAKLRLSMQDSINALLPPEQELDSSEVNLLLHVAGSGMLRDGRISHDDNEFIQALVSPEAFDAWLYGNGQADKDAAIIRELAMDTEGSRSDWVEAISMPALRSAFRHIRRVGPDGQSATYFEGGKDTTAEQQAEAVLGALPEASRKLSRIVVSDNPDVEGAKVAQVEVPVFDYDQAFKIGRILEAQYVLPTNVVELTIDVDGTKRVSTFTGRLRPANYAAETNRQRKAFRMFWSSANADKLLAIPEAVEAFSVSPNSPKPKITRAEYLNRVLGLDLRLLQDLEKTVNGQLVLDRLAPAGGLRLDAHPDAVSANTYLGRSNLLKYRGADAPMELDADLYHLLTRNLGGSMPVGFTTPGLQLRRDLVFGSRADAERASATISRLVYGDMYTPIVYAADLDKTDTVPVLPEASADTGEHWAITLYNPGVLMPQGFVHDKTGADGLLQFVNALNVAGAGGANAVLADAAVSATRAQLGDFLDRGRDFSLLRNLGEAASADGDAPRRLMDRYRNVAGDMVTSYTGAFDTLMSILGFVQRFRDATGTGQDIQLGRIDGMIANKFLDRKDDKGNPVSFTDVKGVAAEKLSPADMDFLRKALYKESVSVNGHDFYWHILGQFGDKDHIFALLMPKFGSALDAAKAYERFYNEGVLDHPVFGGDPFRTDLADMPAEDQAQVRARLLTPKFVLDRAQPTGLARLQRTDSYTDDAMLDPGFVAHQALYSAVVLNSAVGGMLSYSKPGADPSPKDMTTFLKRSGPAVTPGPTMHGEVVRRQLNGRESLNLIVMDDYTPTSDRDREALRTAFPEAGSLDQALEMLNGMTFFTQATNRDIFLPGFGRALAREDEFGDGSGWHTAKLLYSDSSGLGVEGSKARGRMLVKSNWVNLEIFNPAVHSIFDGTVYGNLYTAITNLNKGSALEDQVHVVALGSGAKMYGGKGNTTNLRDAARPNEWRLRTNARMSDVKKIPMHYSQLRMVQDLRKKNTPSDRRLALQMVHNMAPFSPAAATALADIQQFQSTSPYVDEVLTGLYSDDLATRQGVLDELFDPDGPNSDLYEMLSDGVHPSFPAIASRVIPVVASYVNSNVIRQNVKRVLQLEISGADLPLERFRTVAYNAATDSYEDAAPGTAGAVVSYGGALVTGKGPAGRRYRKDTRIPWDRLVLAYNTLKPAAADSVVAYSPANFRTVMSYLLATNHDLGILTGRDSDTAAVGEFVASLQFKRIGEFKDERSGTNTQDYSDLHAVTRDADGRPVYDTNDWAWQDIRYNASNGEVLVRGELWHDTRVPASEGAMHSFLRVAEVLEDIPIAMIATDISTQVIAGADNDGDERHGVQMYRDKDGLYILDDSYEGQMNELFLEYQLVYQDPANFERLTRNVNTWMGEAKDLLTGYIDPATGEKVPGRVVSYSKMQMARSDETDKWNHPDTYARSRTLNSVSQALRGMMSNVKSLYSATKGLTLATKSVISLPVVKLDNGLNQELSFGLPRDQVAGLKLDPGMFISSWLTVYQNMGFDALSQGNEGPEAFGLNEITANMTSALLMLDPVLIERAKAGQLYTKEDATNRAVAVANYMTSPVVRLYVKAARDLKGAVAGGEINAVAMRAGEMIAGAEQVYQGMLSIDGNVAGKDTERLARDLHLLGSEFSDLTSTFYASSRDTLQTPADYINAVNVRDRVVSNGFNVFDTATWYGTAAPSAAAPRTGLQAAVARLKALTGEGRNALDAGWHEVSRADNPQGFSRLVDNALRESYRVLSRGPESQVSFNKALQELWKGSYRGLPTANKLGRIAQVYEEQYSKYSAELQRAMLMHEMVHAGEGNVIDRLAEYLTANDYPADQKNLEMLSTYAATRLLTLKEDIEFEGNRLLQDILSVEPGAPWTLDDGGTVMADRMTELMQTAALRAALDQDTQLDWLELAFDTQTHLSVGVDRAFVGSEISDIDLYSLRGEFLQLAAVDDGLLGEALVASAVRYHTISLADNANSPLRFYGTESVKALSDMYLAAQARLAEVLPGTGQQNPWNTIIAQAQKSLMESAPHHSLEDIAPRYPFRSVGSAALQDSTRRLQWQINELKDRGVHDAEKLLMLQGVLPEREPFIKEIANGKFELWSGEKKKLGEYDKYRDVREARSKIMSTIKRPTKEQVVWAERLNYAAVLFIEAPELWDNVDNAWDEAHMWTGRIVRKPDGTKMDEPTGDFDKYGKEIRQYVPEMTDHVVADVLSYFGKGDVNAGAAFMRTYVNEVKRIFRQGREAANSFMSDVVDREAYIQRRDNYLYHKFRLGDSSAVNEAIASEKAISERTARTAPRTYESYEVAGRVRGLEPMSMNIADMVVSWYDDTARVMMSQHTLVEGMQSMHWTGKPLWLPMFDISGNRDEYIRKMQKAGLDPDQIEERLRFETGIPDAVTRRLLDNLVLSIDTHLAAIRSDVRVADRVSNIGDRSLDSRDQLRRVMSEFRGDLQAMGYNDFDDKGSRFSSLNGWMVLDYPEADSPDMRVAKTKDPRTRNLLKSLEQRRWNHWSIRALQGVQNAMKWASLGLSAFHAFSLWESAVATSGLGDTGFWNPLQWPGRYRDMRNEFARAKADPDFGGKWTRHGLRLSMESAPDFNSNPVIGGLHRWRNETMLGSLPGVRHSLAGLEWYGKAVDRYLWRTWMPSLMLYSAEDVLNKYELEYSESHGGADMPYAVREELMENVADWINVSYGNMDWSQFHRITPKVQQAMHMGIFAPSWTVSSLLSAVGDLPGARAMLGVRGNIVTEAEKTEAMWPAMLVYVMTLIPAIIQAGVKLTLAPDDDEMAWIPAFNEAGKQGAAGVGGHMDLTPLYTMLGWSGGTTGKQRVYMRYAKQSTEVLDGWVTKPVDTFFGKTSMGVKLAFEQFAGQTASGWEMDFKDQPLLTSLVSGKTKGFRGSRTFNIAQKFIPIGIQAWMDDRPVSPFAPTSTGMSLYKAQNDYGRVLATYADEATHKELLRNPKARENLKMIGRDILAAAEKNGVDPKEVVAQAKRILMGQYYTQMFNALEKEDFKGVEAAAARAIRANGTYRDAIKAMENRNERINQKLTKEERAALRKAYRGE